MYDQQVSIIMCTYNGAAFLEDQLHSILKQTHANFELIICDDNSTDATPEILARFAEKDKRIAVYRNEKNIGYNKNFEKAIGRANCKYICISDQDDIWMPEKAIKLLKLLLENGAVLAYHNTWNFTQWPPYEKKVNSKIDVLDCSDPVYNIFHNNISGHTVLFDKTIIDGSGAFPENVYYDWWLATLALQKAG